MSGCSVVAILCILMLLNAAASAPVPRLASMVSAETRGLEVPRDLIAGIGAGSGAMQLVINVHTDSYGNIEVYTN